jgi:K+-transporting ATPase KdpF subunit
VDDPAALGAPQRPSRRWWYGPDFSRGVGCLCRFDGSPDLWLRPTAENVMNLLYVVCGGLALALFVYLIIALLYPEKF